MVSLVRPVKACFIDEAGALASSQPIVAEIRTELQIDFLRS